MKALVTGVTGFVGSHLAEHLLACGDQVLGNSRRGEWPRSLPETVRNSVSLFAWDMTKSLDEAARQTITAFQPDTIYHLAAMSVPSDCGSGEPTRHADRINVGGVSAICELGHQLEPRPRIIFVSSCYVYAPVSLASPIVSEDASLVPQHAYGKTKLKAEQAVFQAIRDHGIDAIIARAFQHTGPRQSPRMIVPDWIRQFTASTSEPIRVGCLNTYLDLTDVRDISRAYRQLAVDGQSGVVYNVGSGICRRSGDLYRMIENATGSSRQVIESDSRPRQHPIANIARLTAATGWQPEISIEQTVMDTVKYWQES